MRSVTPASTPARACTDRAALELEPIAAIQELKDGLQVVVAVRPASQHVQEQVDLGRRRPLHAPAHVAVSATAIRRPPAGPSPDHSADTSSPAIRVRPPSYSAAR